MDLDELYENIFPLDGVPQHPRYSGFSYGFLIVEDGKPMACFYIDEKTDRKMQFIMTHGMIEIHTISRHKTEIFYGYVTDGTWFFCEEQVYPHENARESGLL